MSKVYVDGVGREFMVRSCWPDGIHGGEFSVFHHVPGKPAGIGWLYFSGAPFFNCELDGKRWIENFAKNNGWKAMEVDLECSVDDCPKIVKYWGEQEAQLDDTTQVNPNQKLGPYRAGYWKAVLDIANFFDKWVTNKASLVSHDLKSKKQMQTFMVSFFNKLLQNPESLGVFMDYAENCKFTYYVDTKKVKDITKH